MYGRLAVNAEGDLPFDLVSDTKIEKIIAGEMEQKGVKVADEASIDELRGAQHDEMLADIREVSGRCNV
jgi:hypothetical protein